MLDRYEALTGVNAFNGLPQQAIVEAQKYAEIMGFDLRRG
jgi:hypothetical protein